MAKYFYAVMIMLVFSLVVPSFAQDTNKMRTAFVTDIGGINDNSYNDYILEGLEDAEEKLGVELKVLESRQTNDYLPNLTQLAEEKFSLIWAVGFSMQKSLREAARIYPDRTFAIIDGKIEMESILSIRFAVEESAYLAGAAAALKSKSGKVAFIGGEENNILKKYQLGFTEGALRADEDVEIMVRYTGDFNNPTKAGDTALELVENYNVDVIFHAAGSGSKSVVDAALKNDFYVIGVNSTDNQLASAKTLTNVIKNISFITANETENYFKGDFQTGIKLYDLASGGIGIDQKQAEKNLSKDILDKLEEYRKMIIDGKIDININISQ